MPGAFHHARVVRGVANFGAWWLGESVRCRVLQAHGKIRRRHFDIPVGEFAGVATGERYQPRCCETSRIRLGLPIPSGVWVEADIDKDSRKEKPPAVSCRGLSIYQSTV